MVNLDNAMKRLEEAASDALKKEVEGCFRTLYTKGERLDENDTFE